jgi:hypothetical protein
MNIEKIRRSDDKAYANNHWSLYEIPSAGMTTGTQLRVIFATGGLYLQITKIFSYHADKCLVIECQMVVNLKPYLFSDCKWRLA